MIPPIFLGGACGRTTWRTDIAIPILEAAGIPYFNPQLPEGAWTPEYQYVEMAVKEAADVWLFVFTGDTRGIASIGEVAYRIGQEGKIALAMEDVPAGAVIDNIPLTQREQDDINRGRVYLRAMADLHHIPVFDTIAEATEHAVMLAKKAQSELSLPKIKAILEKVEAPRFHFEVEKIAGYFAVRIHQETTDCHTGQPEMMNGRRWLIEPQASEAEVLRTLLKACLTWEEHEIREHFLYQGKRVFHPHFQLPLP